MSASAEKPAAWAGAPGYEPGKSQKDSASGAVELSTICSGVRVVARL